MRLFSTSRQRASRQAPSRRTASFGGILVICALLATTMTASSTLAPPADAQQPPPVRISEFVASNQTGIVDNTGAHEDWIELENTSSQPVDLTGWSIADGGEVFVFAATTIPALSRLVVFASDEVGRSVAGEPHLPFKLSASGEPLVLQDPAGTISEPSWPLSYPAIPSDIAFGLDANDTLGFLTPPTPGDPPAVGAGGVVAEVDFSVPHGFYDQPIAVGLTTTTPQTTIRYTTNGSVPTETNGTPLAPGDSVPINETTILRAVATRDGWISSEPVTASYFFAADIITQAETTPDGFPANADRSRVYDYGFEPAQVAGNENGLIAGLTAIPSISLVTEPDHLFDQTTGIYENPRERGDDWERPASIELVDPTGAQAGFTIDAGIRIRGGASRSTNNPKHSLHLRFRDEYDGELDYPLFPNQDGATSFEALSLTSSQHGSWHYSTPHRASLIRDLWSRRTQQAMGQPHTKSNFVHLYINGQYWGVFATQERASNQFGADYLGGDEGDYDVMTNDQSWLQGASARDGSIDAWDSLWPLVEDATVTDAEFATLANHVDMENLADYYLLNFHAGEYDGSPALWTRNGASWVGSNNWRSIRNSTGIGEGGTWKFLDHDNEIGICWGGTPDFDNTTPWNLQLHPEITTGSQLKPANLHEALITHPAYRRIFMDRAAFHLIRPGGVLTAAAATAQWDALAAEVNPVVDLETARWGNYHRQPGYDRSDWQAEVDFVRDCMLQRTDIVRDQLIEDGLWPTSDAPEISPADGPVAHGGAITVTASAAGTLYVTVDGSDPALADGSINPNASAYAGPLVIVDSMTVKARVLDNGVWSPLSSGTFAVTPPDGPRPLVLNEWNAVSDSNVLANGDTRLGTVPGNGGDWFELVVTQDHLDIRNWSLSIEEDGSANATLQFSDHALLSDLRAGTIITIAEDATITDASGTTWTEDASYWPEIDDWWIHLVAGPDGSGTYITAAGFDVTHRSWQLTITDADNVPRFGPAGEGIGSLSSGGINRNQVGELEQDPDGAVTASASFGDGDESSFGEPNGFDDTTQDLALIQPPVTWPGDANCDDDLGIVDALLISQFVVGTRFDDGPCPNGDPLTQLNIVGADINRDAITNIVDALLISQCAVGVDNGWCPPPR